MPHLIFAKYSKDNIKSGPASNVCSVRCRHSSYSTQWETTGSYMSVYINTTFCHQCRAIFLPLFLSATHLSEVISARKAVINNYYTEICPTGIHRSLKSCKKRDQRHYQDSFLFPMSMPQPNLLQKQSTF